MSPRKAPLIFCAHREHTRLDRGRGDPDYLGNLPDRFAVIVNKVDDLAVLGREPGQGVAHQFCLVLFLQHELGIVRWIYYDYWDLLVQFRIDPAASRGERLVARDRQ